VVGGFSATLRLQHNLRQSTTKGIRDHRRFSNPEADPIQRPVPMPFVRKILGQPITVRNLPVRAGLSVERTAKAKPDGYTLGIRRCRRYSCGCLGQGEYDPLNALPGWGQIALDP